MVKPSQKRKKEKYNVKICCIFFFQNETIFPVPSTSSSTAFELRILPADIAITCVTTEPSCWRKKEPAMIEVASSTFRRGYGWPPVLKQDALPCTLHSLSSLNHWAYLIVRRCSGIRLFGRFGEMPYRGRREKGCRTPKRPVTHMVTILGPIQRGRVWGLTVNGACAIALFLQAPDNDIKRLFCSFVG